MRLFLIQFLPEFYVVRGENPQKAWEQLLIEQPSLKRYKERGMSCTELVVDGPAAVLIAETL